MSSSSRDETSVWSNIIRADCDLLPFNSIFYILYSSIFALMYGIIFLWRVLPEKRADHAEVMRAVLQAERERCPEVLANLTFGPADDGTCGEIQVYGDEASSRAFPDRVKREDAELNRLWSRFQDVCDPDGWKTLRFENLDFLDDSFVRAVARIRTIADR